MTWAKALAWRLGRQLLDRWPPASVVDVVGRLGAVPAWPDLTAELAVGARRAVGRNGDVARSLEDGELALDPVREEPGAEPFRLARGCG